ncbi:EamA/RhaT family transporter [Prolixibacteraceae bacterium JC049]|nr:EamA/RhaT family transporter [Prolixibacteraceae bacterium JC049]
MLALLLSILCSTTILILFKIMGKREMKLLPSIVTNYWIAVISSLLLLETNRQFIPDNNNWIPAAIFVGFMFIVMFFCIGKSTHKAGIAPTIIAAKMSMIIPILFSIIYFSESTSFLKIIGIITACIAVLLSVYKKSSSAKVAFSVLPIIIFLGTGINDSVIKLAQQLYVPENSTALFSALLFTVAGIIGTIVLLTQSELRKLFLKKEYLLMGIGLGIVNFGSLYFFMEALRTAPFDSSIVFGLNSIAIVVISVLIGKFLFSEKISILNWFGIILALAAVYILL